MTKYDAMLRAMSPEEILNLVADAADRVIPQLRSERQSLQTELANLRDANIRLAEEAVAARKRRDEHAEAADKLRTERDSLIEQLEHVKLLWRGEYNGAKEFREQVENAQAASAHKPIALQVGDVVRLKSGGPAMTVCEVKDGKVQAVWALLDSATGYPAIFLPAECFVKVETE